jgi:hypothetical protein
MVNGGGTGGGKVVTWCILWSWVGFSKGYSELVYKWCTFQTSKMQQLFRVEKEIKCGYLKLQTGALAFPKMAVPCPRGTNH